jgi:predicted nucleic acid-binding protein
MMIFVDTSVWIEFFAGRDGPEVSTLMRALDEGHTLLYTGLVLQELFQGIESKPSRVRVEAHFNPFVEVFPTRETHFLAADLYRAARKQGFQIRSHASRLPHSFFCYRFPRLAGLPECGGGRTV